MERRPTMTRSCCSVIGVKMNASIAFVMCLVLGSAVGYYVKREAPYNVGPNDPYYGSVNQNYVQEPSQRLFWGTQGTNQVGGTGLWATLTNKFPFLGNMFGRLEVSPQYGVPNQNEISTQYGAPANVQPQFYQNPSVYQQQQYPQQFTQQYPQQYQQQFQQQYPQQFQQQYPQYQQQLPQFNQRLLPSARDVAFTDDAVIVTPPQVPIGLPAPAPFPVPAPAPVPSPQPTGYNYDKPQIRLELPHK